MKRNKIAALASALCLLQSTLPALELSAAAEDKLTYGVLSYQVEDGCVTITGCDSSVEALEIPPVIDGMTVTKIGETAFYESKLTSVVIPEGVTDIASGAFWHSKSLSDVTLPSTLETIEGYAFNDCQSLEEISIPESVSAIGFSVFESTPWMTAQREASPFVVINGILIDASDYAAHEYAAIEEERERQAQEYEEAKHWKRAGILTNQVGYFTLMNKKATLLSEETKGVKFELVNLEDGKVVFTGTSQPFGFDADSGDNVHVLDFSEFTTEGTYWLRAATGESSREFEIGVNDNYSGLMYDALNFFYQQRSGVPIESQYITSGDPIALAREAGHVEDIATIQQIFGYTGSKGTQEVSGGWYDAGDHGKYVVNGGISLWLMQNQYERAALKGTSAAYEDGVMKLPENGGTGNGYPDLLDEARFEMDWMLKMIVQDGDYRDMVYHKVHDDKWTALGTEPAKDPQRRILHPPSTAATLNLAACGAQAYRLWKDLDPQFAERCLMAARNAYEAAKKHPEMYAPNEEFGGGGAYNDDNVTDEFYWAACELYIATGEEAYYTDLQRSDWAFSVPNKIGDMPASFDWGSTAALGSMTLAMYSGKLSEEESASIVTSMTAAADSYLAIENAQGYGLPYNSNGGYAWASNSFVSDNAIVMAYAYDLTGNADYLNGAVSALDYLLGRNPLDISYITGYGMHTSQYPHHRFWAKQLKPAMPKAPCGILVGGPNTGLQDPVAEKQGWDEDGTAPQKYYVDDIEAYSLNECAVNWNSSLAWIAGFLSEQNGGIIPGQPSAGKQMPEPDELLLMPYEISITLPEGITEVGEQIFGTKYRDYVVEVTVPEGVTKIGKQAFFNCKTLETINLPKTIELVEDQAFAKTPWLTKMLAESPMLIINGLLIDGTAVTGDVVIPDEVTSILGRAFYMNTSITSLTVPEGVKTIGQNAFFGCEKLTTATLPESLTTISEKAFSDSGLTEINIPASVKKIEKEAFVNCKSLKGIVLSNPNTVIGTEAFGCNVTFTPTGQYSYIFIHSVQEDFVLTCDINSSAAAYAKKTGVNAGYFGDVDQNGEINLLDVVLLNKHIMLGEPIKPQGSINADVNVNGKIEPSDSLGILKYAVKLFDYFPVG